MSIPHVFHSVKPQDFTVTPVTVHKRYVISKSNVYSGSQPITASGYKVWDAVFTNEALKLGTNRMYPTNSFDGSYQHIIWKSIDARYYRFPYDSYATAEHSNERFTYKFLNYSASIFVIPQSDFGEGIQPGTVQISNEDYGIYFQDDGNGNLYDISISTASAVSKHGMVGNWSFNSMFRQFKELEYNSTFGVNSTDVKSGTFAYRSAGFRPNLYTYKNCAFFDNSLGGLSVAFVGQSSYIMTDHVDEFNFATGDFCISFWLYNRLSSSQTIINKSEVKWVNEYGDGYKYNQNDVKYYGTFYTSSIKNDPTPIYPYKFQFDSSSNMLMFSRSDGIHTTIASMSYAPDTTHHHVALVKTGSTLNFYKNGTLGCSITDNTINPYNQHNIVFGCKNLTHSLNNADIIGLSDVRFYNVALSASQIQSLSNSDLINQAAVVGNVFYKSGLIVITNATPTWAQKYYLLFDPLSNWSVTFKNTHTIYQWETIVRIPKGSFNLTQNPTALQNPYTDLLRNEFTSSGNPNTDLTPYVTAIGLYNDQKELMAVAKLSQPLKMRTDVDINIAIRWDT